MFCYQCEEAAKGTGCEVKGVCGKDAETAALQDLLIHAVKGVAMYGHRAGLLGRRDAEIDRFIVKALFKTVTNVDFDAESFVAMVRRAAELRDRAKVLYEEACRLEGVKAEELSGPAAWRPAADRGSLVEQGIEVSVAVEKMRIGADLAGLKELLLYGLKGTAAYACHAANLGREDDGVYGRFHEALDFLTREKVSMEELLERNLAVGELNLKVMELLDGANTGAYGDPSPTRVRVTPVKGKALLVSGHDLRDLEDILKQTEGKGINVYTHVEMLPAHGYEGLRKYGHLAGNYGGSWHEQRRDFEAFPGAIVMTTNCLQPPRESYKARLFTTGPVAWPGVEHIEGRDFTPAIEAALAAPGFAEDGAEEYITVGFGHRAVLSEADRIVEAVKSGAIRRFFLIGGCDGQKSGRNYYTEFAENVPDDCVILTLACGKFRFNRLDFGEIDGIPRLLDMGQCNDAYSAIKVASALAEAFGCDVNQLPLSLVISWYEQKAVAVLLTLLHLGIRNIKIGPSLPAFLTPKVVEVLVERFNISAIDEARKDLDTILADRVYA
ncbi:MAG TPA: hydroxylamine reductase [Deltaproteobacteria bacterium]|nr:hydroxylamine reductase [Deltaproteobacteria bacterium]